MRVIMVMYDSLNRNMLEPYGCDWTKTPNFKRLAERSVQFDNCYVGSLPCMPARRELHTGRSNFLHRSWGPLEPFDDSMPQMLKDAGVYTHLVSDHQHYWEDGGATYHTRYNSWENVRGQEGDPWKAYLDVTEPADRAFSDALSKLGLKRELAIHDVMNRRYIDCEEKMPQVRTFAKGLEFIRNNSGADNWFLQIETFDPHEPFFTTEEYKALYPHEYEGKCADWPPYNFVQEDDETVAHVRYEYAALLSMCDRYLGKVLDLMDEEDMWNDTMLIVNTDHGFLLGEHGWWSKTVMPVYNEIAHTPLFVWDPRTGVRGQRRSSLVQTVDLAPTLLEFFGLTVPKDMEGKPLRGVIEADNPIRPYAVFGFHGGHINITDGRYLYMRAPLEMKNRPLYDYTLMPTRMRRMFSVGELQDVELAEPFSFTKGSKLLKVPAAQDTLNSFQYGNKLFDLDTDPLQMVELDIPVEEVRFVELLSEYMRRVDAPAEQFERLGIPRDGRMDEKTLLSQREHRREQLKPTILPDFIWEEGTTLQFRSLLAYAPEYAEMLEMGFAVYAADENPEKTVTQKLITDFLELALSGQGDILEFAKYVVALLSRSK